MPLNGKLRLYFDGSFANDVMAASNAEAVEI